MCPITAPTRVARNRASPPSSLTILSHRLDFLSPLSSHGFVSNQAASRCCLCHTLQPTCELPRSHGGRVQLCQQLSTPRAHVSLLLGLRTFCSNSAGLGNPEVLGLNAPIVAPTTRGESRETSTHPPSLITLLPGSWRLPGKMKPQVSMATPPRGGACPKLTHLLLTFLCTSFQFPQLRFPHTFPNQLPATQQSGPALRGT